MSTTFDTTVGSGADLSDDEALEARIADYCEKGAECGLAEPDLARVYFGTMTILIAQRSPDQIERMERERGLLR